MKRYRVLVVGNEASVVVDIEERLVAMGYDVAGRAMSGEAAIALAEAERPDLVLMDIRLQGAMDGIAAAKAIKDKHNTPVIFLTAHSEDDTLARAMEVNPFAYILKPFEDRELRFALEIALQKHAAEREIHRLNRLYSVLSEVNQAVVRVHSVEELLASVCRVVVERGALQLARVSRFDPARSSLEVVAQFGDDSHARRAATFAADRTPELLGTPGRALEQGSSCVCNDVSREACPFAETAGTPRCAFSACASFPLQMEGKLWGILTAAADEREFFQEKEVALLEEVALDLSFALEKLESDARHRRAEAERLRFAQRYEQLVGALNEVVYEYDVPTGRMNWSGAARRVLGCTLDETEATQDAWLERIHPDDRDAVRAQFETRDNDVVELEYRSRCKDGRYVWLYDRRTMTRDGSGVPVRVAGVLWDCTERKQAEEALKESEGRYRALVETSPDAVLLYRGGSFTFLNPAAVRLLGAANEGELLGRPVLDFVHPDYREGVLGRIRHWDADGNTPLPLTVEKFLRVDGQPIEVEVAAVPLIHGGMRTVQVIARDITERKNIERALEEDAIRRHILIDQSRDGIVILDSDGKVWEANERFASMLGYSREDIQDLHVWDWDGQWGEAELREQIRVIDLSGDHFETRYRRKDGSLLDVEVSTNAAVFSGEKLVFCMCRDISLRKRAEARLREERERIARLTAISPVALFSFCLRLDGTMGVPYASPGFMDIFGLPHENLIEDAAPLFNSVYEEDRAGLRESIFSSARELTPWYREYRVMHPDKGLLWLEGHSIPALESDGVIVWHGAVVNITLRKQADAELRNSEAGLQEAQQIAGLGRWVRDFVTGETAWSESIYNLLEVDPALVKPSHRSFVKYIHPADRESVKRAYQKARDEHSGYDAMHRLLMADGRTKWVRVVGRTDYDTQGLPQRAVGVIQEITDIKGAEDALRASEARYRRLFEDATEGIVLADAQTGEILACNEAFYSLSGYDPFDLLGKQQRILHPAGENGLELTWSFIEHQGEKEGEVIHEQLLRKDGTVRQVEIKAHTLELSGRKVLQGFFRDVTEELRRQHERETTLQLLRLLNDEGDLHALIETLTRFLQECTGCEAIGVRLKDGDDFPYFETFGFPGHFVRSESSLCARGQDGAILLDEHGDAVLDCMCGNVLRGRFDASLPFFTSKGTFWTNCTSALLAGTSEEERQGRTRNYCNGAGYESVALIPLCHGGTTMGLLQLNDRARDRFTEESITFLEGLADQFAVALAQRQTQAALRVSEQRFAAVAEHSGEVIWEIDDTGLYTYVSRASLAVWGYSPEEMIGRLHFCDLYPEHRQVEVRGVNLELMRRMFSFEDLYRQVVAKDGRLLDVLTNAAPIVDKAGVLLGYRGADRDITGKRAAERLARKDAERTEFLLDLHSRASQMSEREIFDYALDKAVKLTDSEIGFCHRISEDENTIILTTWNDKTLEDCSAPYKTHYPITEAGNWTDCIGVMAPVVYNDFKTSPNQKGLPEGHSVLRRFMSIPLLAQGRVRLIFGVGNKSEEYTPNDVEQIQLVANELDKILAQREAQEALRKSEQRFRDISEAAGEFIWETNAEGRIEYVSERITDVLGYKAGEVMGRELLQRVLRSEEPETAEILVRHIQEKRAFQNIEVCQLAHDGSRVWLTVTAVPVLGADGAFSGFRGASLNISERKNAEEILREAFERSCKQQDVVAELSVSPEMSSGDVEAFAARLTEKAAAAGGVERVSVWLLDETGDVLHCIDLFESVRARHSDGGILHRVEFANEFGYLMKGRYVNADNPLTDPRTRGYVESYLKPLRITSMLDAAIRVAGRTVGTICFEHVDRPHHWQEDEITFICQLADQTALALINRGRREVQADRERLEAQLHQAQKMESVGRLAGGVAHDFNNMLGVILGQAQLSLLHAPLSAEIRDSLEEIQEAARRSADLTRQLLAFARRQTVVPKVLDLNDTISGMLKMLRRLIGEDIELAWIPGVNLWPVKVDPSQIDQILANLLVNARDAIEGTGAVTLRTENLVADAAYCGGRAELLPGEYVLITVQDTGVGVLPEAMEHIFEPFFTTKEMGKGTGLGLATVYGIVKQNGGYITVNSQPGQGTTFSVFLHRISEAALEEAVDEPAPAMRGGHETVLLVEDSQSVLKMSETVLLNLGYRTLTAADPTQALTLAAEYPGPIHVLITDVVMPKMNGRDLAEQVQALRCDTKCLFISGYTSDVIATRGVLEEGVNFLEKPFTVEALARKVREILDRA